MSRQQILVTIGDEVLSLGTLSERTGIARATLSTRYYRGLRGEDLISPIKTKGNIYVLCDNYYKVLTRNKNGETVSEFLISLRDKESIDKYTWCINNQGYPISWVEGKLVLLHRFILKPSPNLCVDHKNRNRFDCRRENLRICTYLENNKNASTPSNNKSGYAGVWYFADRDKWVASIMVNHKKISLGYYKNKEDAIRIRLEAERKYFSFKEVY